MNEPNPEVVYEMCLAIKAWCERKGIDWRNPEPAAHES